MRAFGSPKPLEKRRRKAMELLGTGLSLNEVAQRIGAMPVRPCVGATHEINTGSEDWGRSLFPDVRRS